MFETLIVAARDRQRLGEVARILSRYGLDVLLARIGLAAGRDGTGAPDLPRRTREALEALGPTYIKLGQILATRADLLPTAWIAELGRLHADAPTIDFALLRDQVEQALGEPPETAFAAFDPVPLAAASMAQVHRAAMHDGRAVVLKIRRPGIRPLVEADLRLLAQIARVAEAANAEARRFQPEALVRQLADAMLSELDFTGEGRNADLLRTDFAGNPNVVVPTIHWEWTSETLLVMDHVAGVAPTSGEALRAAGIDPRAIAERGTDAVLDMVLVNGRFHADPHPGNLLCLPGGRIALLDLGMIGHVSPRRREEFIGFVQALVTRDADALADTLARWAGTEAAARERLRAASDRLVARHGGEGIVLAAVMADLMALLREEGMTMPPDLLLVFKALLTIDGVLHAIVPGFDLSAAMRRAIGRIAAARLAPDRWLPTAQALAWELSRIGDDAPRLLRALVRQVEGPQGLVPDASPAILRAGRWIAGAVLAGAVLIATAVMLR